MNQIINDKQIAILLGVYNGAQYIRTQIDSLLSQTYKEWTLYVRDDNSTDNTLEILKEYSSKYENIVICCDNLGNLGCNGNYFELLKKISSKYYMFCNADDFWYSQKVEISYNTIIDSENQYPGVPIIVHTDLSVGDIDLKVVVESSWNTSHYNPEKFKSRNYIPITNMCAGATMIFNESAKKNAFPICGDQPFFDHWIAYNNVSKGKIFSIYEPTMIHRQIGHNLAGSMTKEQRLLGYKLRHLRTIFQGYIQSARLWKSLGWGGYTKYFVFKFLFTVKSLRSYF